MNVPRFVSLGVIALVATVVAGGMAMPRVASAQDTAAAAKPKPKKGNSNLITESEVAAAAGANNAYEVVERVRPSMLRRRSSSTGQGGGEGLSIMGYVDEVRSGDVESLRSVSVSQIREIRFISATDATQRWGTGHMNGVVQVITKR